MNTLDRILHAAPGARPIHRTLSFQGLALVFVAAGLIMLGLKPEDIKEWIELLAQLIAMIVTLIGIARRPDVRIPKSMVEVLNRVPK